MEIIYTLSTHHSVYYTFYFLVMDFIVKDLDSNYRLDAFRNKAEKIIVEK